MTVRAGALTIDLDDLGCYAAIHALRLPAGPGPDPLLGTAVERFGELCADLDVPATAFVIGGRLEAAEVRASLRRLLDAGHEIGSHSLSHDYRLSLRSPEVIAAEVRGAAETIEAALGVVPRGFRAPGYNLSPALLAAVEACGHRYDASALPSLPYLGARAAILGAMALRGRLSASHAGPPGALLFPQRPYRPDRTRPWRRGSARLVELPISVVPPRGLPFIGTAVTSLPAPARRVLLSLLALRPFLHLELHAIDLLDTSDGLPEALAAHQPDLRIPAATKIRRLRQVIAWLRARRPMMRLDTIAEHWESAHAAP